MTKYSIEVREAFEKKYISIDIAELRLLEPIRDRISSLDCVHRVNISNGKRKHLTVYLQKFYSVSDCVKMISDSLNEYDDSNNESIPSAVEGIPVKELVQESQVSTCAEEIQTKPEYKTAVHANQLENIPSGCPIVFISYAWDDDAHKVWTRKLSDDLRSVYGVYTLLDQYNRGGDNLVTFMISGLKLAQRVLIIGSPKYAKKIDEGLASGVAFEDQIINAEIYNGYGASKFIPVLRKGTFKTSFGTIIGTNVGYDMSDDAQYEQVLESLAADLWDEPVIVAPALAPKPAFHITSSLPVNKRPSPQPQPINTAFDPYKGEKGLMRLLEAFSFNLMDGYFRRMPNCFNCNILTSFDMWTDRVNQTTFTIKDKTLADLTFDFYNQWKKVLDLGEKHYDLSRSGIDYYFTGLKMDLFVSEDKENAFYNIYYELMDLQKRYKSWSDYIKNNYPDIDLEETSLNFENNYC